MTCLQFIYNQFIENKKNYKISVLNGLLHRFGVRSLVV